MSKKYKVLVLSDHALSTSGVGTQTRHLLNGLVEKGCWSFRQFGAAMKHENYDVVHISDDFIIKPTDGFGNKETLRLALATEQPDILFIFTDPRFFVWLFEMEDEIHQVCPIVWWHVWDNTPYPEFNDPFYEATDQINCHSHHTYTQLKSKHPKKTNFIPHALPEGLFYPLPEPVIKANKPKVLNGREDHFVMFWVNRNARRKRPNDLLYCWSKFIEHLQEKHGHKNATLLLHTDPMDPEGPQLFAVTEHLGIRDQVVFSNQRVDFPTMNLLHNIADVTINISYAEGFGLSTLEAMMTGTPIIAPCTGGQTRQVVNAYTKEENGVALPIEYRTLVGSQGVPYIWEDHVSNETITNAMIKMYEMGDSGRKRLGRKALEYARSEFGMQKTIDLWHQKMVECILTWKNSRKSYELLEIK